MAGARSSPPFVVLELRDTSPAIPFPPTPRLMSGRERSSAEIDVKKGEVVSKEPNPEYEEWFTRDQQVLGFIFTSVSKEVLGQIVATSMAAEAWAGVADIFVAHTCARSVNVCLALATTKKGAMTITEYVTKMQALGDEVKATDKPLEYSTTTRWSSTSSTASTTTLTPSSLLSWRGLKLSLGTKTKTEPKN
jgi:hypothetical protein